MKKLLAILLAGVMVFGCVACGTNGENGNGNDGGQNGNGANPGNTVEIANANEILSKVWTSYCENAGEELQITIFGGNMATMVMDEPQAFDVTLEDAKLELSLNYCIPEATIDMTDDVATIMNIMNANIFTSAAYHVTDASKVSTVVSDIKDATLNNQWMCGFPEKLIIVTIGDSYVVSAFGNGQVIDAFKEAIVDVYGDAAVFSVEETIE